MVFLLRGIIAAALEASAHAVGPSNPPSPLVILFLPSIYHPYRWCADGKQMTTPVRELRAKTPDSEKITLNLGYVDLGHIDLLVAEAHYSNRTDFIRTAIRNQLDRHAEIMRQSVTRRSLDLGLRSISRKTLEDARAAGERLELKVLGLLTFADDVAPELARETIASITVLGAMHASPDLRQALADRTY